MHPQTATIIAGGQTKGSCLFFQSSWSIHVLCILYISLTIYRPRVGGDDALFKMATISRSFTLILFDPFSVEIHGYNRRYFPIFLNWNADVVFSYFPRCVTHSRPADERLAFQMQAYTV